MEFSIGGSEREEHPMNPELTPIVLAELRGVLEVKRDRLQADIAALRRAEGGGTDFDSRIDVVGDSGDSSVDLEEQDRDRATQNDLRFQLDEVEHALERMDAGTYGICEECGRPIPLARLRILPEARYDAQHQAEVEARNQR
jgi:RNA polymerase-binding transcription factor DksA